MKQLSIILILFTISFGYCQNDNPYAVFGYKGNTIKTIKERMKYMLIIPNQDTLSIINKIGIEPKEGKYYLFDKENKVVYKDTLDIQKTLRFFSVDPLAKDYPHNSPYAFSENDVIRAIELEGLERLIVSNINKEDRKANLTIKKTALMVKEGLDNIPQHGKFSSKSLNSLFARGNTNIHFQGLPQNGIEPTYANTPLFSGKKYRVKNDIYKVSVEYDVNIKFVSSSEADKLLKSDPILYSKVNLGDPTLFPKPMNPAKAESTGTRNKVFLSPTYFGENPTGPIGTVGEEVYPNRTELLAHELGSHNMMGHSHPEDKVKKTKEYSSPGLKGAVAGSVYPLRSETQEIINTNKNNIEIKK